MACPDLESLERHLAGDLAAGESRELANHLESCPACAGRVDEISENLQAFPGMRRALLASDPEPAPPERIGSFTIVREIDRGGMGVVYLAEQDRPRRRVALKVLRSGATSADTLRRFELEAEVLARLRHPGIATIYEAGVTTLATGAAAERVPYIAMEYVRGERIDRHVAAHRLALPERLELVARLADAVDHAHGQGLVHRDLKPGNVLVEPAADDPGRPKVLDFGVARIADADGTRHTTTGQILGTIPYMSPEQLAGDPAAVDSRSDVYALGVIAFELATGELPHDVERSSIAEAARAIRDDDPRSPRTLAPELPDDVATILLKALEKEPGRRYASAAELAADIRRFLGRRPIRARPPSSAYQLRRFAQRNRGLAAALAGLFVVLIAAAGVSGLFALRAREQLAEARRQADKFEAVGRFLEQMLAAASPEANPGRGDVSVREALELGVAELDEGSLGNQPTIELGVRTTVGNTFRALGEFEAAQVQLERAVELGRATYPDGHEELADALNKLGRVLQERGDYDGAEAAFRESLEMRRELSGPVSDSVARTLNNLAHVLAERGDLATSLTLHREALAVRRELFGSAHEEVASSLNNIAFVHYQRGDLEQAETMFRDSLEMNRTIRGEMHPDVASTMNNLAMVIGQRGRPEEAEPLQRRALELEREIYGPGHPKVAVSLQNLALALLAQKRPDEAEPLFEEALTLERGARGSRHPAVANLLGNYARLHEARGDYDTALKLHDEALGIRREVLGDDHVATLGSRYNLARVTRARGQPEAAARSLEKVAADARRVLPGDSNALLTILAEYGTCLIDVGELDEAEAVLREAQAIGASGGGRHPRLAEISTALARLED